MSNSSWKPNIFELNPHSKDSMGEYDRAADADGIDPLYKVRVAINGFYEEKNKLKRESSWKAICLHSHVQYFDDSKSYSLASFFNKNDVGVITVIARIPELDSIIPFPDVTGESQNLSDISAKHLGMHRKFTKRIESQKDISTIPSPGDIIEVDFEGGSHLTGIPIYLGIYERGIGIIPDGNSSVDSGKDAFSSNGNVNTLDGVS